MKTGFGENSSFLHNSSTAEMADPELSSKQLRTVLAEFPAQAAVTFCDVDLTDAVALAQPDRNNAHEVGVHLLLRVLLPPHRQRRVAACRHQVLIEQPVLGHCKWQRWLCEGAAPLSPIL